MNFLFAVIIGAVIGLAGGFALKSRQPNALWLAPALAVAGALVAALLALIFGDDRQYGWKEITLQIVLALVGVAATYYLGTRKPADTTATPAP
ncbi:GlsB/YeaQ/YmgE family stress response membrane protein [Asanoa sp. NPDC050611]|uniref:GlsB/YeaQ/YmgE family stress response membrane protein n=1 Tax=Asanoa sp. NPDC050611 TaxID=3157098 RepID=UPI0033FA08AD